MQQPAWRKALWCEQQFPDNHTDDNFLECLVINADVVKRSYWRVVWASLAVDQQVCFVAIVASTAYHLYQGTLPAQTLLAWEIGLLVGGAVFLVSLAQQRLGFLNLCQSAASIAGLIALTAALSPIYATLTASISPDTIVSCAAALLLAHLYLHDYRRPAGGSAAGQIGAQPGPSLRGSLGLACAMCASVLMASQLPGLADVFALMVLSLELYIMAPPLQYTLFESAPALHAVALSGAMLAALHLLSSASVVLTSSLICTLMCITFLCPMWLVRIHKFKAQINGPWDEAAPKLAFDIQEPSAVAD